MATAFQSNAFQASPAFQIVAAATQAGDWLPQRESRWERLEREFQDERKRKKRKQQERPEFQLRGPQKRTDRQLTKEELERLTNAILAGNAERAAQLQLQEDLIAMMARADARALDEIERELEDIRKMLLKVANTVGQPN